MTIKPVNITLDFSSDGSLILTGTIRVLTASGSTAPASIFLTPSSQQSVTLSSQSDTGSSVYGTASYFPFVISIASLPTLQYFTISGSSISSKVFAVPFSGGFVVPSLSVLSSKTTTVVNVTIAAQEQSYRTPRVILKAPIPQQGTLAPAIRSYEVSDLKSVDAEAGCNLLEGSLDLGVLVTGSVAVELLNGDELIDLLFL